MRKTCRFTTVLASLLLQIALIAQGTVPTDTLNQLDGEGRKQGYWIKRSENGVKVYEGRFKGDVPVDTFFYYDYKENVKARMVFLPNDTSRATIYYQDGTKAAEGTYVNKEKWGEWRLYDGEERLSAVEHFKAGKKHGSVTIYYDDGSVSVETEYRDGLQHGLRKEFWIDGKKRFEGTFKDGNPDGEVLYYNQEGKLSQKGYYENAVRHGKWLHYGEYGITKIEVFEYGEKVDEKSIENAE